MADVESGKIFFVDYIVSIMYFKWHMHWYDSNLWTYHKEITNYDCKMYMKEKIRFKKIAKMTVTDPSSAVQLRSSQFLSYGHLIDFLKSEFLFHIHFSVVICDFLVDSSSITIVLMHVSFKIHYRNNLIDKKDSYLIPCTLFWDDRNYSYGHHLYPSV
jgi:hypothetical protein